MALIQADRTRETTTTTGTGNVTLAGAVTGFQAFSASMADGDQCFYAIADQSGANWEIGIGTFVAATPALARTTVLQSSNADAVVNFGAGTKDVFITAIAERFKLPEMTSDPTPPASGVYLYTRPLGGRHVPRWIGPSGLDTAVQPAMFGNAIVMWLPGTSTTAAINFGIAWTTGATQAHPTIADTNIMTAIRRATFTTTTTAANASGVRSSDAVAIRNRGFFFAARFGILTYSATMRIWCGLTALNAALSGDPSANNNSVAMSKDTAETVWQVFTRDTTAASKTSTGRTTAAAGNSDVFDFYMFCKPGDTKITVRVVDIATNTVLVDNVDKTSNLPASSQILYAQFYVMNVSGGAGSAVAGFLSKIYVETDL